MSNLVGPFVLLFFFLVIHKPTREAMVTFLETSQTRLAHQGPISYLALAIGLGAAALAALIMSRWPGETSEPNRRLIVKRSFTIAAAGSERLPLSPPSKRGGFPVLLAVLARTCAWKELWFARARRNREPKSPYSAVSR